MQRELITRPRQSLLMTRARSSDLPHRHSWEPLLLGGSGVAQRYVTSLGETERAALRERLQPTLPIASDGSISIKAEQQKSWTRYLSSWLAHSRENRWRDMMLTGPGLLSNR